MRKEIVLPYDLYHRIRVSSEEHGGIGRGMFFDDAASAGLSGAPFCAHGHAWGTCTRAAREHGNGWLPTGDWIGWMEPELYRYLSAELNDVALLSADVCSGERVPFVRWCELLNVKCGPKQGEGVDKPRQVPGILGNHTTPEPVTETA